MAALDGADGAPLLDATEWNWVVRDDERAGTAWIQQNMRFASAVVVLVGEHTDRNPWVRREIFAAWSECRPLLGVHAYGIVDADGRTCEKGKNPFHHLKFRSGGYMSDYVPVFEPQGDDPVTFLADLEAKLPEWTALGARRMQPRLARGRVSSVLRRR